MVRSLGQLENLVIERCKSMEWVVNTNGLRKDEEQMIGVMVFPNLKSLALSHLPRLRRFVYMRSSEENEREKVEILFGSSELSSPETEGQQSMFLIDLHKVALLSLEILKIAWMNKLRKIWHHQFDSDSFSNLKQLEIRYCDKLINIFSSNIIRGRRFQRLERVEVIECKLLKEIIEEETSSNRMVDEEFPIVSTSTDTTSRFPVFPQLTSLKLERLPALQSIYQGVHMFEWPMLKNLAISSCKKVKILFGSSELLSGGTDISQPVFLINHHKVGFPNLKTLTISSMSELRKIWNHQLDSNSFSKLKQMEVAFPNLKNLKVKYCNRLRNLATLSTVGSLVKLVKIEIDSCKMIEEIVQQFGEVKINPIVFGELVDLKLHNLQRLEHFLGGNYTIEFSYLEQMVVSGCLNMKIFSQGVLRTPKLQKVKLTKYYGKENEERWDGSLNSTIQKMFEEMAGFYGLYNLTLSQVPQFKEIWYGKTIPVSCFCNLSTLVVDDCKLMLSAIPANLLRYLKNLRFLIVKHCDSVEELFHMEELNIDEHSVKLLSLYLIDLPKLKRFCNFSRSIIELPSLKYLTIANCPNIETFISNSTHDQPLFNEKVSFPNLKNLKVKNCNRLRNLATLSTIDCLVQLERIEICSCKMIEEIVQQVGEENVDLVFSQLVDLRLDNLPRLQHFLGGNYTLEFPYLKQMAVSGCLNMKIFCQGVLRTPKLQKVKLTNNYGKENEERWEGSLNSTIQKMFEEMAGFYGLNNLIVSQVPRLKEIWYGQTIPVSFYDNLRSLEVDDCKLMLSAIPANLLRFLNNLITLKVRNCDFVEEVVHLEELNADEHSVQHFPNLSALYLIDLPKLKRFCNFSQSIIELPSLESLTIENCPNIETFISNSTLAQPVFNEKVTFHNLRRLKLSKLPKLLHLCMENSSPIDDFQNLETLIISECSKLEEVVPSWVSFQNLIKIKVSECDGLTNLMALSTAKSLMKLKRMKITNCKVIEEIIPVIEEVKKDCIVFCQLKYLELSCLPSLTGFFLGNHTLEFSSLEQVIVKECSNMEIFSRGVSSTPKLERLQLTEIEEEEIVKEDDWLWEGSLNSTIQKLFEEKNVQSSKDEH